MVTVPQTPVLSKISAARIVRGSPLIRVRSPWYARIGISTARPAMAGELTALLEQLAQSLQRRPVHASA